MENTSPEKIIPTGVKILSVLFYLESIGAILLGILFMIGAGFVDSMAESIPILAMIGQGLFIGAGLTLLVFGIIGFFIGRGLWKGKNWARIVVIVVSILLVLMAVLLLITGGIMASVLFNLLINGFVAGYLLFSKSVKEAFVSNTMSSQTKN